VGDVNLRDRGATLRELLRATEEKSALIRRRALDAIARARDLRAATLHPRIVQLEEALEWSQEAIKSQQQTLATVSHELRQVVGALVAAWTVAKHRDPQSQKRAEDVIDRQLLLMQQLVNDLADASRLTFDITRLERRRITVREDVEAAVDSVRSGVESHQHKLICQIPDPPLWIDADPIRLQQVLSNLLTNADNYTPPGGRIDVRVTSTPTHASIEIADNGQGIAAERLPTILEPFKRGHSTGGGLGLGLAIAAGFVRLHGGTLEARSEGVGQGAEFVVTLPLAS